MSQQKIHPAVLPLIESWGLHNTKLHLLFLCFSFSLRTMGHNFIFSFWSFASRIRRMISPEHLKRITVLSSVTLSLCTSVSCKTDPFLLTSVLPVSPCFASPNFCPFTNTFPLCCLKYLDFQHFILLWRKCNRRRKNIGDGQEP